MAPPPAECVRDMQQLMDQIASNFEKMSMAADSQSKVAKDVLPAFVKLIEGMVKMMVEEEADKMEKVVDGKIAAAISKAPMQVQWLVLSSFLKD
jgi:nitrate/nitrite-specific signal transduction histidine kinase